MNRSGVERAIVRRPDLELALYPVAVEVTIRASFNTATVGMIGGGLTASIPAEQKEQYAHGSTPAGQQTYR